MAWLFDDEPWDDESETGIEPPNLEVEITDPLVIGLILGPDGEPLHSVFERDVFPFGFCRPD